MKRPVKLELELDPAVLSGQMVLAGFEGKKASRELLRTLAAGRLSGVILFARNLESPAQIRKLTDAIREASPYPPIIAVDWEGGRVRRFPEPFLQLPPARSIGKLYDRDAARALARAMAQELRAVGINTNLAPVLDVDTRQDNPAIGDRSFSSDAVRVGRLGAAMIEGLAEGGVVSCGKHFPGHGDTMIDSHFDLPVVDADLTTLYRRELPPFQEAIRAGVPMIMAGHLKVPGLDKYYPAAISRKILNDLLREEMGFEGVIVTDDLEMAALSRYMTLEDAGFSALRAGADLLLTCSGLEAAERARMMIIKGLELGIVSTGELALAVSRVLALKECLILDNPPPPPKEIKSLFKTDSRKIAFDILARLSIT